MPSSATTPSASRAPPECQSPTTGTRSRTAVSIASTMCRQPSAPRAPPIRVPSVTYATTGVPSTSPRAVSAPESSRGFSSRSVPWSNSERSRISGSRWSTAVSSATGVVVTISSESGPGEYEYGVVPAEPERVVERGRDVQLARLERGHVEVQRVVRVLQVDRGGHDAVVEGEDRDDGLDRAGRTDELPRHRLARRDDLV